MERLRGRGIHDTKQCGFRPGDVLSFDEDDILRANIALAKELLSASSEFTFLISFGLDANCDHDVWKPFDFVKIEIQ